MMEAVILAGGLGTRLRAVVSDLPKPMAPVAGKPFLELLLRSLRGKGFKRIVLSVGYLSESIVSYFGNSFDGLELIYAVESEPLGTGGALRLALLHCKSDHVFVFNGDTYLDLEIDAVEDRWMRDGRPLIIARHVENTERYGRLAVSERRVVGLDSSGRIGSGLINAGCYVIAPSLLQDDALPQKFSFERDFLPQAITDVPFNAFLTQGRFIDIGVPEDYARAQIEFNDLVRTSVLP